MRKAIKILDIVSLVLAMLWCAWLPILCAIDLLIVHLPHTLAMNMMIVWACILLPFFIIRLVVIDVLEKRVSARMIADQHVIEFNKSWEEPALMTNRLNIEGCMRFGNDPDHQDAYDKLDDIQYDRENVN